MALRNGNPRLARNQFAQALGLWRGDALSDIEAEGLLGHEAARLDDLRLACLECRIEADLLLDGTTPSPPSSSTSSRSTRCARVSVAS